MPEHLVRHIPGDIAQRAGRGVAPYHRRARYAERSKRGVVRRVREVDEDAEAVELPHECLAEWAGARMRSDGFGSEEEEEGGGRT